jgi:hypothetical protein
VHGETGKHKDCRCSKWAIKSDIKILLVDDREDNLFSIETILEKIITQL